jgi:hypothetical protein
MLSASEADEPLADSRSISTPGLKPPGLAGTVAFTAALPEKFGKVTWCCRPSLFVLVVRIGIHRDQGGIYLVLCRPGNDLTGGDLGRVREQGSEVLFYEIRGQAIRFFLCFSCRKNAYRNRDTVSFVHQVVRNESRDFTNQWYEFLYSASRLFRIRDTLISTNG